MSGAEVDRDRFCICLYVHETQNADQNAELVQGCDLYVDEVVLPDLAALTAERDALRATVERVEAELDPHDLECGRLGLSCTSVIPPDRWCRACRLHDALNPPSAPTSAPHSASEGSSGPQGHRDDERAGGGDTCSPDCPAAIREAHLRQRLTELADRLARGSSAVCDLLDEAEGPGERGEG